MGETKILVYGAGTIGSLFAGKIALHGYDVTVLARNERFKEISSKGIMLRNTLTNRIETVKVKCIDKLKDDDLYDYIIVAVQNGQIGSILPILAKNKTKNIVFSINNPLGYDQWIQAVGEDRIMLAFPSAGGERLNGEVNYFIGKGLSKLFQSTTLSELNGRKSLRLNELKRIFKISGFSPSITKNMDAWQKTHVGVAVPIALALYKFDSDNYKLSESNETIEDMIKATRECFKALNKIGVKVTPSKLNIYYLPLFIIRPVFKLLLNTKKAEFSMAKHTIHAKEEMKIIEEQFKSLFSEGEISFRHINMLKQ